MKTFLIRADEILNPLRRIADKIAAPLLLLAFRLYPASVFFKSGWGRFQSYLNDDWGTQIFLFDFEHPVPGIPPEVAAPITTAGELFLPVLLATGLFGRFGAAGMIAMTLVIEFTYQHNTEHLLWLAMLSTVFILGPGTLSLDKLLTKWLRKDKDPLQGA